MQTSESINNRLKIQASGRFNCSIEALHPEIKLMIDWMSSELGSLHRELRESDDSIERRILQRLTPDTLSRPVPADCILYTQPKKETYLLNPEDDVFTLLTQYHTGQHPLFFTPLAPVQLLRGKVKYLACGSALSEHTEHIHFKFRSHTKANLPLSNGSMWVGLQLESKLEQGQKLCFCIQTKTPNSDRRHLLYRSLALVSWELNGQNLLSTPGLLYNDTIDNKYRSAFVDEEFMFLYQMEKDALTKYKERFVQVEMPDNCKANVPEEVRAAFDDEQVLEFEKQEIRWFKLLFPSGFTNEDLADISLQLNCFPAINRRLDSTRDFTPAGDRGIEIRALSNADNGRASLQEMGAFFLGIQRVFTRNEDFKPVIFDHFSKSNPGFYALQHGQVEADDMHDMYARIGQLTDHIDNHVSRLTLLNQYTLQSALEKLKEGNKILADALREMPPKDQDMGYYLHLKIVDPLIPVYIRFWITQGKYASGVAQIGDMIRTERLGWIEMDTAWVAG